MSYDLRDAKRRNENASVTLLRGHLVASGVALGEPRPGDPDKGEPDAVCDSPLGVRGLEATNVFYDADFAAWTWGMAIEAEGGSSPRRPRGKVIEVGGVTAELSPLLVNPHRKLTEVTRKLLDQKCAKTYAPWTYLIVDARTAGVVTAEEAPRVLEGLTLPAGCGLLGAYLCLSENITGTPRFFEVARS